MNNGNGAKPPVAMQSREPKSIRFMPTEWDAISRVARSRGLEPAVFARMLTMYALIIVQAPTFAEASAWLHEFGGQMLREPQPGTSASPKRAVIGGSI